MSNDPNVFETESLERQMGAARGSRLGPGAGSSELGCALYELDPGGQALDGSPTSFNMLSSHPFCVMNAGLPGAPEHSSTH